MARLSVLAILVTGVAAAAPCKDMAACTSACDAGDPVACVLQSKTQIRPLAADRGWKGSCDFQRDYCGAHHWAGVGTKQDHAAAIAEWQHGCDREEPKSGTCLAYAKAVESTKPEAALAIYRELCQGKSHDLACRAAGRMWKRVEGDVGGAKYSIELPGVMRDFSDDHPRLVHAGELYFLWSSPMKPTIVLRKGGSGVTCTTTDQTTSSSEAVQLQLRDDKKWLPAGWGARACASVRSR